VTFLFTIVPLSQLLPVFPSATINLSLIGSIFLLLWKVFSIIVAKFLRDLTFLEFFGMLKRFDLIIVLLRN